MEYGNFTTAYFNFTTAVTPFNISNHTIHGKHICYKVLYWDLNKSGVKLWDLLILLPNIVFFGYLLFKLSSLLSFLRQSKRFLCSVLFALVLITQGLGVARCVVSMTVHNDIYSIADRVMWLFLKFFLLASELSVLTFGVLCGHLDSRSSIKRVLVVTFLFSLLYSSTQGILEFVHKNDSFHFIHDGDSDYTLFGHGGMIFWFTSSFLLSLIYGIICFVPLNKIFSTISLPSKRSFYVYCGILSFLNFMQGIGSVLLYVRVVPGLCILDVTTYLYFTSFAPLIYVTFLYSFLRSNRSPSLFFSYRHQSEYMRGEASEDYAEEDDDLLVPSNETLDNFDALIDDVINSQLSSYSRSSNNNEDPNRFNNKGVLTFNNPFTSTSTNDPDFSLQVPRTASTPLSRNDENALVDLS